jgi:hypothetical protein
VSIPTESPKPIDLQSEIKFQVIFKAGALRLREQSEDDFPAFGLGKNPFMARLDIPQQTHGGSQSRTKMNIRSSCRHSLLENVYNFRNAAHGL